VCVWMPESQAESGSDASGRSNSTEMPFRANEPVERNAAQFGGFERRLPSQYEPPPTTTTATIRRKINGRIEPPVSELDDPRPGAAVCPGIAEVSAWFDGPPETSPPLGVSPDAALDVAFDESGLAADVAPGSGLTAEVAGAVLAADVAPGSGLTAEVAGAVLAVADAGTVAVGVEPGFGVPVGCGLDVGVGHDVGVGDGGATKVTAMVKSEEGTSNEHVGFVECAHGPVRHSENAEPASGSAVNVNFVPSAKSRPHRSGHLIPVGVLKTLPVPPL